MPAKCSTYGEIMFLVATSPRGHLGAERCEQWRLRGSESIYLTIRIDADRNAALRPPALLPGKLRGAHRFKNLCEIDARPFLSVETRVPLKAGAFRNARRSSKRRKVFLGTLRIGADQVRSR